MADQHRSKRICSDCGAELSIYGDEERCAPCQRTFLDLYRTLPPIPAQVWADREIRDALAGWDLGTVARLVRQRSGLRQEKIAELTGLSQGFLSQLESGRSQLVNIHKIIGFLDGLGTPTDLRPRPAHHRTDDDESGGPADGLKRSAGGAEQRRFEQPADDASVLAAGAAPAASLPVRFLPRLTDADGVVGDAAVDQFVLPIGVDDRLPSQVTPRDVEIVRSVTSWFAGSENSFGGEVVVHAGLGQLGWGTGLLRARSSSPTVRHQLFEAVGNLAGVVGFAAFDAGDISVSARCFRLALSCADEGECWPLRACTLADIARVYAATGDVDAALSAIEFAKVRMDRLSHTARAMLCVMHARYLALAGRDQDALREIDAADTWFDGSDPHDDPPWLCYYDRAEHDGSVGRALMPIAESTGRPDRSRPRLESAIRLQGSEYPRSRVFSRTRLARLLAKCGDPDEAAAIGARALTDAKALRSRRVAEELAGLFRALDHQAAVPPVQDLREELREHLTDIQLAASSASTDT